MTGLSPCREFAHKRAPDLGWHREDCHYPSAAFTNKQLGASGPRRMDGASVGPRKAPDYKGP